MKILVVDDNVDFADGMAEMLDLLGHEVQTSYSCDEALAAACGPPFELALIDIGLADKNGADCARDLGRLGAAALCVLTTGYSADALAGMGVSIGKFDILRKPVKPEDLMPYLGD